MKISIIDFAHYHGRDPKTIGSTYLRSVNLVAKDKDFFHWTQGARADAYIFQKVYWDEIMRLIKEPKILDLADPDIFKGKMKGGVDIRYISQFIDAITCSSEELTKQIKKYVNIPVYHVPDRLNFDLFPEPKIHKGRAKTVVWFGYAHNAKKVLQDYIGQALQSMKLKLLVVSDKEFMPSETETKTGVKVIPEWQGVEIKNIKYDSDTAYYEIRKADIAINPSSMDASFKYKSNNKTIIAWRLGLPQANCPEDFQKYLDPEERNKEVAKRVKEVEKDYDIKLSGIQYKDIIKEILKNSKKF